MKRFEYLLVITALLYGLSVSAQLCSTPSPSGSNTCPKPVPGSPPPGGSQTMDIYGGQIAGHVAAEATGLVHAKKVNKRWIFYSALGNPFWEISFDNARITSQLGVDVNGNGGAYWTAQKYALGKGPQDGFTDVTSRWAYYVRAMAASWGFTGAGQFSYSPVVPDTSRTPWVDPRMGTKPSNKMTFVITHNNSPSAMASGAKNIYASVWSTVGVSPYFVDPYDPNFAASVNMVAHSLASQAADPWVRYVFTGEEDQLRGLESTHPHLGFIVAATNPVVASDMNAWGGKPYYYSDTKNYAKFALRDYLQSVYATIALLNAAWGTHYTTFDSAGGWGAGTGFLDESGKGLCATWYKTGPSYPCANVRMQADLDAFATLLVRQYYKVIQTNYRAVTKYMLEGPDISSRVWGYSINGMLDTTGKPLIDLINLTTSGPIDSAEQDRENAIYAATHLPMIVHAWRPANNDSAVAMRGTVTTVTDLGNTTDCGVANQAVLITSGDSTFWWWNGSTNGNSFILPWSNLSTLKFSSVPYYKKASTPYLYYFRKFSDAHSFIVCPLSYGGNGNKTDFLSMVHPGDTFKRMEQSFIDQTADTQEARGDQYASLITSAWSRADATSGDQYIVGIDWWAWWDNNWVHSIYNEIENYGLVTPRGNAYDGVQAIAGKVTDQWGFPAGGEATDYGNFLGKVTAANKAILKSAALVH